MTYQFACQVINTNIFVIDVGHIKSCLFSVTFFRANVVIVAVLDSQTKASFRLWCISSTFHVKSSNFTQRQNLQLNLFWWLANFPPTLSISGTAQWACLTPQVAAWASLPIPTKQKPEKKYLIDFHIHSTPKILGVFLPATRGWCGPTMSWRAKACFDSIVSAFHFAFAADSFVLPCGLISTNNV